MDDKAVKSRRTTITFSADLYADLKRFADEWGISVSEVVRLAVCGNLERYLGSVQYVDSSQAKMIADNQHVLNRNIGALFNVMQSIRNELRRIGINYNQEVRILNTKKKQDKMVEHEDGIESDLVQPDRFSLYDLLKDEDKKRLREETSALDMKAVENLIERFEKSAKEVGEKLCRIQV